MTLMWNDLSMVEKSTKNFVDERAKTPLDCHFRDECQLDLISHSWVHPPGKNNRLCRITTYSILRTSHSYWILNDWALHCFVSYYGLYHRNGGIIIHRRGYFGMPSFPWKVFLSRECLPIAHWAIWAAPTSVNSTAVNVCVAMVNPTHPRISAV